MGAICTKPNTNNVSNPSQFIPNSGQDMPSPSPVIAFMDEILYINTKYKDSFSILSKIYIFSEINKFSITETSYLGSGIKKTFAYKSHISQEELFKKREEFWGFSNFIYF